MIHPEIRAKKSQARILTTACAIIFTHDAFLFGCGSSTSALTTRSYTPLSEGDWPVSIPEEQGLDSKLLDKLYKDAAKLETLYGLLVIKNGYLIAEQYFNEGSIDQVSGRTSSTKSFTSALVGIALDQGCLQSVDQKMMDFFPSTPMRSRTRGKTRSPSSTCCRCAAAIPTRK